MSILLSEITDLLLAFPVELECGTGEDHREDKTVKGEEGGGDCTPGRAAAADISEVVESMPTTPMSVPPATKYQFTSEDTIKMDTSQDRKDDDLSLIVHVDESLNDLDSDLTGKGSEVGDTSAAAATKAAAVDSSSNVQLTSVADTAAPNADNEEAVPADKMAEEEATTDGGGPDAGAPKPVATASEEGGETTGEGQAEKDTAAASTAASAAASVDKINTSAASKEDKPKRLVCMSNPFLCTSLRIGFFYFHTRQTTASHSAAKAVSLPLHLELPIRA